MGYVIDPNHIQKFWEVRTRYGVGYANKQAELARQKNIPWCDECKDWHHPTESHSSM